MKSWKPAARIRTHFIFAGGIWSLVGLMLMVRGGLFLHAAQKLWLLAPSIAAGTLKSLFMLDRSARRNRDRLLQKTDGACLGGVYSVKMWLLVVLMIVMGRLLRTSGLPLPVVGTLYAAIGWALFFSSRILWRGAAGA